jgi:hypothetical protein
MTQQRIAVDQVAEEYWKSYFKEYGKQWVRKIPRRVAAAIATALTKDARTAGAGENTPAPPAISKATIAPLGWAQTPTGGLTFEGIFRGVAVKDGKPAHIYRAFSADFNADGELSNIRHTQAA